MAASETRPHAGHQEKDLRIVLLGTNEAGKSSSGNTILGREEFDTEGRTAQCVKREGEVAGRHVTVVEAPGWDTRNTEETPNNTKDEIELSVSLCPPGPHALLVVTGGFISFTETVRRSVQKHLELLGDRVWSHTIVLFTLGHRLGDTPIEQYIDRQGESLQWLVEKCGNRYHVFNNERRDDHMQVTQLMEKIEEMVAANRGQCYKMQRWRIERLEEKKRRNEERGKMMMVKVNSERESLRSQTSPFLSELRIVLLGYRYAGKSESGNTILGRQEFDYVGRTAQCVKRQGEVAGRHVTVVEAPGWKWTDKVYKTSNLAKEGIALSASLCPPGPHALLLAVDLIRSLPKEVRRLVQQHLQLLGERVWSHTIVLFTHGDWLGDIPIEQYIASEGENLQWLVEKCGNRYHVLNNNGRRDEDMQVTQLMEKIEELVATNRGQCYATERCRIEELKEKRRRDEERGIERMMKMKRERESLRSQMGDTIYLSDIRILLLGMINSGKSESGNTILGREEFVNDGRKAWCVKTRGIAVGRHVTVVEAPGWMWKNTVDQTSKMTKEDIELSASLCPPGPHAILLVIGVDRSFPNEVKRSVQQHLELLGEGVWSHTIVLFARGDLLGDTPIEQHIECEGESLQWLVEKCGNRYHVLNTECRDIHMQVTELMEKIEEMVAANRGQCYANGQEDQQPRPVRKACSHDWLPPDMSGESDSWSFTSSAYSSAYSSFRSTASSDISSLRGSMRSTTSSQSSGIGSSSSRTGSGRSSDSRGFKFPNLLKLRKALNDVPESQEKPESKEHEEDDKNKSTKKKK